MASQAKCTGTAKITNINEMEALYKEGKISKATLWRGKKRGYICLDYHTPKKRRDCLTQLQKIELYESIRKLTFWWIYKRAQVKQQDQIGIFGEDVVHDVYLYALERNIIAEEVKKLFTYIIKDLYKRKRAWSVYMFIPLPKTTRGGESREVQMSALPYLKAAQ